ncbi:MAG TPA: helicase-exonuclease AddAB subunit AddB [Desulfotomaculum sp.]|nr:MAG: ATP-dependent helicase [Desulfotomaculum sp. BICA1-6]HBX24495.1 helicase-exonuclease AddAB subunit AddB [Desulfotomaculum sp.]
MHLNIVTGRAGAGKTTSCLRQISMEMVKQPLGSPLIMLVPEQASFQTEKQLARTTGVGGYIRAQVLGFRRLAYRVLQETGGGSRVPLGETGKRMVLRRMLESRREELRIFHRAANLPGFVDQLAGALGEMKIYRVGPNDLQRALTGLPGAGEGANLEKKLQDLLVIFNDFEVFTRERFTDPDDYLTLAAEQIRLSGWLNEVRVWVDGFTGFTPQEYDLLAALLRRSAGVTVALCLPPEGIEGELAETDPFYPVWETYNTLIDLAAREKVSVMHVPVPGGRQNRFVSPGLAHLEQCYFRQQVITGAAEGIKIAAAADRRAEVEGMAREITRFCRDLGYRWRDVVILLREVDLYAGLIESVFSDYGIPFFLDHKRTVLHHPLVELIRAALETVAGDWPYDPVFRYLKTDLVPVSRAEVDKLENYVLAHGIRGTRWTDDRPWDYRRRLTLEEDTETTEAEKMVLDEINSIRTRAATALSRMQQRLADGTGVKGYAGALYGLLEELHVPARLEQWSRAAAGEGRLEAAGEHAQVWEDVVLLLDELVEALGDEQMNLRQFTRVLEAGFASIRLGLIPPGLDQVVVGSLERSRSPEVKAAFVPGVNEGVLPARVFEQGIFSEAERERLQGAGLRLAPGARRRAFDEQYIVYQALTRSGEQLVISYPLADGEGRSLKPSPIVHRLRELFPTLGEGMWTQEPGERDADDMEFVSRSGRCLTYLAGRLRDAFAGREIDPLWWDVYNWFVRDNSNQLFKRVVESLFNDNSEGRLSGDLSGRLYGRPFKTSVSALEKYYSCAYAHYLAYGLRLKERNVFRLEAPDMGQFFHAALKMFAQRLLDRGIDWGGLSTEQCHSLAGDVVDELTPRLQSEILLSSARHRYLSGKLKRVVQRSAMVLSEHARRGEFRPVGLELAFGMQGGLGGVTFALPDGSEMILRGCIDRVDAADAGEDGVYLRVIDYKSGLATIKLDDVWQGLKLQLLAYLDVALRYAREMTGKDGLPGAVLYFRVDDPLVKTEGEPVEEGEIGQRLLRKLKMNGLVLADRTLVDKLDAETGPASDLVPVGIKKDGTFTAYSSVVDSRDFKLLLALLQNRLVGAGGEILAGVKDINPYRKGTHRACRFCSFKPVCRFDPLLPGNAYRVLKTEKNADVLEKTRRELGVRTDG